MLQNGAAVYVRPPGAIEADVWVDVEIPRKGMGDDHAVIRTVYEIEIGIPYR